MMSATRIIAVRHGETPWNVETRLQGHIDIPLNDRGRWQAERVARALAHEPIARIYSSDLSRAWETARTIAHRHPHAGEVHAHTGLRERAFGTFEGQTYADIAQRWPEDNVRWKQRDPHFAPPGGETPTQIHARIASTVTELARQHPGEQIVLVAHGGVLDMLYRLATQQSLHAPRTWDLGNATINRLLWTPEGMTLVGWADNGHLDDSTLDEGST